MKWKKGPTATEVLSEKTFLVIKEDLDILERNQRGKLKMADTGTWPPKMKRGSSVYGNLERPKTANLEKPSVLDPNLVDKLDMSVLSKELLGDSMTLFRHSKIISGGTLSFPSSSRCRQDVTIGERRQQQQQQQRPASNGTVAAWCSDLVSTRYKRRTFEQILDTRLGHVDVFSESPRMQKQARITGQDTAVTKKSTDNKKLDDNNNRNGTIAHKVPSLSTLKKKSSRPTIQNDLEMFTASSTKTAPEPCKSCGAPNQPERFHSHPKSNQQKIKDNSTNSKTKTSIPKTVQKPVALHFRSDKNKNKIEIEEGMVPDLKSKSASSQSCRPSSAPIKKGPRTITCYICGREFGTASFPIHEPRCMQKWERENNCLPANQRRPIPQRPETAIVDRLKWNAAAWEESQAQLIPCFKCGRTFLPERLSIHQKSCKAPPKVNQNPDSDKSGSSSLEKSVSTPRPVPPTVACQSCGRNFGTKSIKIHEPRCIKRSQMENDRQPRRKDSIVQQKLDSLSVQEISTSPTGEQQKRMVTCYICGRAFGSTSITIHEPQCLKKWHVENEKLLPGDRRKEPQRPELIYTRDPETGSMVVDVLAMAEANWKSHLNQLVPCKYCGRTFNPDRVSIHERSCKGNR